MKKSMRDRYKSIAEYELTQHSDPIFATVSLTATQLISLIEQVEGLEQQADDMAEKHAEKDIVINNFQENKRLEAFIE